MTGFKKILAYFLGYIMRKIEGKPATFIIPEDLQPLIERLTERHNIKEAQALRALLLLGADFYQDMEKVGLPQTAAFIQSLRDRLHKKQHFYEEKVVADLLQQ